LFMFIEFVQKMKRGQMKGSTKAAQPFVYKRVYMT
jgi:hypothetical protein